MCGIFKSYNWPELFDDVTAELVPWWCNFVKCVSSFSVCVGLICKKYWGQWELGWTMELRHQDVVVCGKYLLKKRGSCITPPFFFSFILYFRPLCIAHTNIQFFFFSSLLVMRHGDCVHCNTGVLGLTSSVSLEYEPSKQDTLMSSSSWIAFIFLSY